MIILTIAFLCNLVLLILILQNGQSADSHGARIVFTCLTLIALMIELIPRMVMLVVEMKP